jgi:hypothetical protein
MSQFKKPINIISIGQGNNERAFDADSFQAASPDRGGVRVDFKDGGSLDIPAVNVSDVVAAVGAYLTSYNEWEASQES